ncbi:ABC transporter substrate-binding protein [Salinicola sp. MH3R3-1]|uniref:ABC transporter substrate-binding protein n=1 Tax=Salinicola sp. MH3R3-1 TaxID=1928762 RepID=UPI0009FA1166|nr:ABC transporter substrate-binding protein [Salinicola sp. MH3R3-1]
MLKHTLRAAAMALGVVGAALSPLAAQADDNAICYNCPPEWADWGTQLKAIEQDTGIHVPQDNKNSGQSLASITAEKSNPVADVVYYGVTFGIQAAEQNLVQAYKPAHWDEIPAGLKDPDGKWFAIHSGTLGFMVNVDALGDTPVPQSWEDLLKPEYRGLIGYLDPSSAFVGYVGAVAVNGALGGSLKDFTPAIEWFQKLQENDPIVPKQTAYARVLSGEIPILLDYDFNAYRARYDDNANVQFVIPQEGTITVPYVMSLVANDPNPEAGKKVLDYVLSDKGQSIWADAYLRPVRPGAASKEAQAKFLPDSDYARAGTIDYAEMAAAQRAFSQRYANEVD